MTIERAGEAALVHVAAERPETLALLARDGAALDRALARVAAGTYGTCASCGRPVGAERLAARPEAETCVACAAGPGRNPGGR